MSVAENACDFNLDHVLINQTSLYNDFLRMTTYYELYRRTSIGIALTDALDELVSTGQVDPQLALKVLANFDKAITDELANNVKSRLSFKGNLNVYRSCDEVWTFILKNATFKFDNETVTTDRIKIIACNSKKAGE